MRVDRIKIYFRRHVGRVIIINRVIADLSSRDPARNCTWNRESISRSVMGLGNRFILSIYLFRKKLRFYFGKRIEKRKILLLYFVVRWIVNCIFFFFCFFVWNIRKDSLMFRHVIFIEKNRNIQCHHLIPHVLFYGWVTIRNQWHSF